MDKTCERCDQPVKHGALCNACIADDYDDFDDDREPEDDGFDDCGMTPDGYCMLAGTEHCDWDCPLTYSSFAHTPKDRP